MRLLFCCEGFFYDSSIAAPLSRVPVWPYSLDYRMPHKCHGNAQNCPSRSWAGLWEMPINELDRRDDPSFDERLSGCHLVSSCSNIYDKEQFGRMIRHNFERHYLSNRAPLSLSFDAAWLKTNKGFTQILVDWMTKTLRDFQQWKEKCDVKGQPYCSLPNACPLTTRE